MIGEMAVVGLGKKGLEINVKYSSLNSVLVQRNVVLKCAFCLKPIVDMAIVDPIIGVIHEECRSPAHKAIAGPEFSE